MQENVEVERAFTIPDNYTKFGKFRDGSVKQISNTQRYKMLGNGFVIDILVEGILKNLGKRKKSDKILYGRRLFVELKW